MDRKPLLGPLLGYHGECLRSVTLVLEGTASDVPAIEWSFPGMAPITSVASPLGEFVAGQSIVWKATVNLDSFPAGEASYRVRIAGKPLTGSWEGAPDAFTFHHQPDAKAMNILFGSCMDRHDLDTWRPAPPKPANPIYGRFLAELPSRTGKVHLMLLGGDQVYTDFYIKALIERKPKPAPDSGPAIDAGIRQAYLEGWNRPALAQLLATVPHAMMWDDHDLYDGFGSYVLDAAPFQKVLRDWVYPEASRLFDLLQLKQSPGVVDRSWVHTQGDLVFAALDARTDRDATGKVVVDPKKLGAFATLVGQHLGTTGTKTLILVLPIPLMHLRFDEHIPFLTKIPYPVLTEVIDDIIDNWSSTYNRGAEAVMFGLVAKWRDLAQRVVILSGDSHMGSAGLLDCGNGKLVYQVTSSALENQASNPGTITGIGGAVPRLGWKACRPWQKSSIWFPLSIPPLRYRMVPVEGNDIGFANTSDPFKDFAFFTTTRNAVVLQFGTSPSVKWILEGDPAKAPRNPWTFS